MNRAAHGLLAGLRRPGLYVAAPIALVMTLAACDQAKPLYVDGAYVRLSPNPDNPAAGYFTIHGGSQPVTLRSIETDAAVRLEMHESVTHEDMASMAPIETVEVPAGATVAFAPGGRHVMIWQINQQAIAAGKMELRLIFSNGDRLLVDALIQKPDGEPTGTATGPAPSAGTESETVTH